MEKKSYFNVGRRLSKEEYSELKLWAKQNPTERWNRGDVHPITKKLFVTHDQTCPNGEYWTSSQSKIDKFIERSKEWMAKNREAYNAKALVSAKRYHKENREKISQQKKERRKNRTEDQKSKDRDRDNKRTQRRRKERPLYRLSQNISGLLRVSFKKKGYRKKNKTEDILGLSIEQFKKYMESLFEPWMNWDNYGGGFVSLINTKWEIDHIVPISTAKSAEDVIRLNHFSNLRPLCVFTNRYLKKDNLDWQPNG